MTTPLLGPGFAAFALTAGLAPVVLVVVRRLHVLDVPNSRSSHAVATPRGGGIAVAIGAGVGLLASSPLSTAGVALLVTGGLFAVIGLGDDVWTTSPFTRLALQVAASVVVLPWMLSGLSGSPAWQVLFGCAVVLWLVGYVNVFNFMDGINGISASQALVAGAAWVVLGEIADEPVLRLGGAVIAAAAVGFAPYNVPTARMFLGDVGSYFLGGWLAALVVVGLRAGLPFEAAAGPVAVYLVDTATTLARRVRRGDRWFEAHREHVYQQLTNLGWSHMRTTAGVSIASVLCCLLGMASLQENTAVRVGADLAAVVVLVLYVRAPALLDRPRLVTA